MRLLNGQPVTCFLCTNCDLEPGGGDYSDVTPGEDFSFECHKGHFLLGPRDDKGPVWHETIMKAQDCPDMETRGEAGR